MADPLKMKIVVGQYGHTEPVTSGRIPLPGVQPEFIKVEPLIAAFRRMVRDVEFDACEVACTTYIASRAYGRPFKALPLFLMRNFHHAGIVYRDDAGIKVPKDLEGKKLGAPAPDGAYAQWKIFTQANGIDASKVTIENVGFPVREPMLQNGQVDAITGFSFSSFINLKSMGVPTDDIVVMLMADHGVNLYGNTIIVNPKFAAEKPEAVKGFLRAFVKGLKDTVTNTATAVDSVIKRNDVAKKDIELERLRMALKDNMVTDEVKRIGYGAVDPARLEKAIEQIGLTYEFKNPKPKAAGSPGAFLRLVSLDQA